MSIQSSSLSQNTTMYTNNQLLEKIVADSSSDPEVIEICSEDFVIEPTDHLIHEMIARGVGRSRTDDDARAFIMGQIPGFIEKVSSPGYLRSFAVNYFKNDPNRFKIMQVFEQSLQTPKFNEDLKSAVDEFNNYHGEEMKLYDDHSLRVMLTIFPQSEELNVYTSKNESSH